jgi:hypothetical protein
MTFWYVTRMDEQRSWCVELVESFPFVYSHAWFEIRIKKLCTVHDLTITATVIMATVLWVGPTSTESLSNQFLQSCSVCSSPLHSGIISFFSINPRSLASLPWRSLPPLAVAKSCRSAFRKKIKRRAAGSQRPWLVSLYSSTFGLRVSYLPCWSRMTPRKKKEGGLWRNASRRELDQVCWIFDCDSFSSCYPLRRS